MNRFIVAFSACIGVASAPALAGHLVDVAIVERGTAQRIPLHRHQGKLYIVGKPGDRYAVSVINRSAGRLLAVVAVDGINAVTGETASADQNGYVLAPHQSFDVLGWRKNLNEVAAFYFTRLPDSYAARTDRPDQVGVIGIAVFREWTPSRPAIAPHAAPPSSASGAANEAESRSADRDALAKQERIGTGHGEHEHSAVAYTNFRRATGHPNEIITIYYDTHANLVARGIIPAATPVVEPNPFPGGRFVPDPRG